MSHVDGICIENHTAIEFSDSLILGIRAAKLRPKDAWKEFYRSLSHSRIRAFCCAVIMISFQTELRFYLSCIHFLWVPASLV